MLLCKLAPMVPIEKLREVTVTRSGAVNQMCICQTSQLVFILEVFSLVKHCLKTPDKVGFRSKSVSFIKQHAVRRLCQFLRLGVR